MRQAVATRPAVVGHQTKAGRPQAARQAARQAQKAARQAQKAARQAHQVREAAQKLRQEARQAQPQAHQTSMLWQNKWPQYWALRKAAAAGTLLPL